MADINESILTSVKKLRGIDENYTHFDPDIIMCINSALSIVTQLGVGPSAGFSISDKNSKWSDLLGDQETLYEFVKTYISDRVAKTFDPPANSSRLQALEENIREMEWRISVRADEIAKGV